MLKHMKERAQLFYSNDFNQTTHHPIPQKIIRLYKSSELVSKLQREFQELSTNWNGIGKKVTERGLFVNSTMGAAITILINNLEILSLVKTKADELTQRLEDQ